MNSTLLPFKHGLVRMGRTTYHLTGGKLITLGDISGPDLRKLGKDRLLPVIHIYVDPETLVPVDRERKRAEFRYDYRPGSGNSWDNQTLQGR